LILNELITNAVKHAFSGGRRGRITLRIHRSDHELVIALLDDGAGFADLAEPSDGIGQTLVQRLSRQIGATTHWDGTEGGVSVTVALPAPPEEVL
jgi:two-component sensor histidine kinase